MLKAYLSTLITLCFTMIPPLPAHADLNDSWVTVTYTVTRDGVKVLDAKDGTDKKLAVGEVFETSVPRSALPAGTVMGSIKSLTEAAKRKLESFIAALPDLVFKKGKQKNKCGYNADLIKSFRNDKGVVVKVLRDGSFVTLNRDHLNNGDTALKELDEEYAAEEESGSAQASSVAEAACPIPQAPKNLFDESLSSTSTSALIQDFEKNNKTQIDAVITRAQFQVALRVKNDHVPADEATGCCAAFVARALELGCLTPSRIARLKAVDAALDLPQGPKGWVNIFQPTGKYSDEANAPRGAILIYEGGDPAPVKIKTAHGMIVDRRPNGHIAIKTTDAGIPGYISDFETERPPNAPPRDRNGVAKKAGAHTRRLIGIWINPNPPAECEIIK